MTREDSITTFNYKGYERKENAFKSFEEAVFNWETIKRKNILNVEIVKFFRTENTRYLHYVGDGGYEKIFSVEKVKQEDRPILY